MTANQPDPMLPTPFVVQKVKRETSDTYTLDLTRARVVLPLPGGPQKIMEENSRPALSDRHNKRPGPTRCAWPTNSARVRARIRAARGGGGAKSEGELSIRGTRG